MWHNLGEAAEKAVARHRQCLRAGPAAAGPAVTGPATPVTAPAGQPPRSDRFAVRTRQRHAAIWQLLDQGLSVRAISSELGLARNTACRFARASDPEELLASDGTGHRPSMLAGHEDYLRARWNDGCTDAALLWRELRARGYPGGYSLVRDYLAPLRGTITAPVPAPKPPKARKVTSWIMTRPGNLTREDRVCLAAILGGRPELAALQAHVQAFAQMMTGRRGRDLEKWITAVLADTSQRELRSFITGIRRDQDAVTAGLTLPYSSGTVEGHVNRIILWNQNCQIGPALAWRTSTIGRMVALAGRSSCRGVGPDGVGMSASRSSSRSRGRCRRRRRPARPR